MFSIYLLLFWNLFQTVVVPIYFFFRATGLVCVATTASNWDSSQSGLRSIPILSELFLLPKTWPEDRIRTGPHPPTDPPEVLMDNQPKPEANKRSSSRTREEMPGSKDKNSTWIKLDLLRTQLSKLMRCSTVNVRNPNTFGFQTGGHRSVPNCFEQTKVSEIQTFCSVIGHKFVSEIGTADRSNLRFH